MAKSSQVVYEKFVDFCSMSLEGENPKFLDLIKTRYEGCDKKFCNSEQMICLLEETQRNMAKDESRKFVHLKVLLTTLKINAAAKKRAKKRKNSSDSKTDALHAEKIPKLKECSIVVEKFSQDGEALFPQDAHIVHKLRARKMSSISDGNFNDALNISVADDEQVDSLRENLGLACYSCLAQSSLYKGESSYDNKPLVHYKDDNDSDSSVPHQNSVSIKEKSPRKSVSIVAINDIDEEGCIKASAFCCIDEDIKIVINDGHEPESSPVKTDLNEVGNSKLPLPNMECTSYVSCLKVESPRKKSAFIVNVELSKSPGILIIEAAPSNKSLTENVYNLPQSVLTETTSSPEETPHVEVNNSNMLPDTKSEAPISTGIYAKCSSNTMLENPSFQNPSVSLEALNSVPLLLFNPCMSSTTQCESEKPLEAQEQSNVSEHDLLSSAENGHKKQDCENVASGSLQPCAETHHQNSCRDNETYKRVPLLSSRKIDTSTSSRLIGDKQHHYGKQEKEEHTSISADHQTGSSCMDDKTPEAGESADEFQEHNISTDKDRLKKKQQITKLERLLESLRDKIEKCQDSELTLDDLNEEVTSYMYEDKLKKKFVAVWNKLCELTERSVTTGRPTERTIRYTGTRYTEINRRIEKFLNKKKIFPDFHDVKGIVKLANKKCNLNLNSMMVNDLAREAFVDIGEMLQRRRHQDFISTFGTRQTDTLRNDVDPYLTDPDFRRKLDGNRRVAKSNLDNVIAKYAKLQYERNLGDEDKEADSDDEEKEEPNGSDNKEGDRKIRNENAERKERRDNEATWKVSECFVTAENIEVDVAEDGDESILDESISYTGSTSIEPATDNTPVQPVPDSAPLESVSDSTLLQSGSDYNPKDMNLGRSSYLLTPNKNKSQIEKTNDNNIPSLKLKVSQNNEGFNKKASSEIDKTKQVVEMSDSMRKGPNIKYTARKAFLPRNECVESGKSEVIFKVFENNDKSKTLLYNSDSSKMPIGDRKVDEEEEDQSSDSASENDDDDDKDVDKDVEEFVLTISESESASDTASSPVSVVCLSSDSLDGLSDSDKDRPAEKTMSTSVRESFDNKQNISVQKDLDKCSTVLDNDSLEKRLFLHAMGMQERETELPSTHGLQDEAVWTKFNTFLSLEIEDKKKSQKHQAIAVSSSTVKKHQTSLADKEYVMCLDGCLTPKKRTGEDVDDCIIIDDTPKKAVYVTEVCTDPEKVNEDNTFSKVTCSSESQAQTSETSGLRLQLLTTGFSFAVTYKDNGNVGNETLSCESSSVNVERPAVEEGKRKLKVVTEEKMSSIDVIERTDKANIHVDVIDSVTPEEFQSGAKRFLHKTGSTRPLKDTGHGNMITLYDHSCFQDSQSYPAKKLQSEQPLCEKSCLLNRKDMTTYAGKTSKDCDLFPISMSHIVSDSESQDSVKEIVAAPEDNKHDLETEEPASSFHASLFQANEKFHKNIALSTAQAAPVELVNDLDCEQGKSLTFLPELSNGKIRYTTYKDYSQNATSNSRKHLLNSVRQNATLSNSLGDVCSELEESTSIMEVEGDDCIDEVCVAGENLEAVREQVTSCNSKNAPDTETSRKRKHQNYIKQSHNESSQDLFKDSFIVEDKGSEVEVNEVAVNVGLCIQQNINQQTGELKSNESIPINKKCLKKQKDLVDKQDLYNVTQTIPSSDTLVNHPVEGTHQCSADLCTKYVGPSTDTEVDLSANINQVSSSHAESGESRADIATSNKNSNRDSASDKYMLSVMSNSNTFANNKSSVINENVVNALCNTTSSKIISNSKNKMASEENKVLVNERNEPNLKLFETIEDESVNNVSRPTTDSEESVNLLSPVRVFAKIIDDCEMNTSEGISLNEGVINTFSCLQQLNSENEECRKTSEASISSQKLGTERVDSGGTEHSLVVPCSQNFSQDTVLASVEETSDAFSLKEGSKIVTDCSVRNGLAQKEGFSDVVEIGITDNCKKNEVKGMDPDNSKVKTIQKNEKPNLNCKKGELVSLSEEDEEVRIIEEFSSVRGIRSSENSKEDDRRLVDQLLIDIQLNHANESKLLPASSASKLADAGQMSVECWEECESVTAEGSKDLKNGLAKNISRAINTNSLSHSSVLSVECEEVNTNEETLPVSLTPVSQSKAASPSPDHCPKVRENKRSHETASESDSTLGREHESGTDEIRNNSVIDVEASPLPKKQKDEISDVITNVISNVLSQFPSGPSTRKLPPQMTPSKLSKNLHGSKQSHSLSSKSSAPSGDDDDVVIMDETPPKTAGHSIFPLTLNRKKHFSAENQAFKGSKTSLATTSMPEYKKHPILQTSGREAHILSSNKYNKSSLVTSKNEPIKGSNYLPSRSKSRPLPHSQASTTHALLQLAPRVPIPTIQPNDNDFSRPYSKPCIPGTSAAQRPQLSISPHQKFQASNSTVSRHKSTAQYSGSDKTGITSYSSDRLISNPKTQLGRVPNMQRHKTPGLTCLQAASTHSCVNPPRSKGTQQRTQDGSEIILGDSDEETNFNNASSSLKIVSVSSLSAQSLMNTSHVNDIQVPNTKGQPSSRIRDVIIIPD